MNRAAFKMKLKSGAIETYKERHNAIWPELVKLLHDHGVSNYSIFFDEETNTLFGFQLNSSIGSQALGEEEIVQKWWKHMADIMVVNPDFSPVSIPLEEVFYLD